MRRFIYLIFVFVMLGRFADAQKAADFIQTIPGFAQSSSFEEALYTGLTWQEFYKRADANQVLDPAHVDLHLFDAALVFASNKVRQQNGKKPLTYLSKLRNAASRHSYLMVKQNFFDHVNPKPGPYATMSSRISNFGFDGQEMGENIAKAYIDLNQRKTYIQVAEDVIKQFMNSPPHKANLLKTSFQWVGEGAYFYAKPDDEQFWYFCVTQDFGTSWK
jgi:uncharacterized protein YkwD